MLEAHPSKRASTSCANPLLFREPTSPVFHGRDLFGPAAGRIARGLPLEEVGPVVADPVRLAHPPKARLAGGWEGAVLHVDRFGNLTTNLLEADLAALGGGLEGLEVTLGAQALPLVRSYSDVRPGRRARSSARAAGWRSPSTVAAPTRCPAPGGELASACAAAAPACYTLRSR